MFALCDNPYALLVQRDGYKRDLLEIAAPEIESIVQPKIQELLLAPIVKGKEAFYFAYGNVAHILGIITEHNFCDTAVEKMLADCICAVSRGVFDKDFHEKLSGGIQKEQPTKQELASLLQAVVAARWEEYNDTIQADSCYAPYFRENAEADGIQPIDGMTEGFSADAKQREIAKMYLLKHAFKHRDRHQKLTELPSMPGYLVYQDDEDNDYGQYEGYENFRTFIVPSLHYKVKKYFSDQPQVVGSHKYECFHGTNKRAIKGKKGILKGGPSEGSTNFFSKRVRDPSTNQLRTVQEFYTACARKACIGQDDLQQESRDQDYIRTTTYFAHLGFKGAKNARQDQAFLQLTNKFSPNITSKETHGKKNFTDYVHGRARDFRLKKVTCFAPA